MKIKSLILISFCCLSLLSCKKDRYIFTMNRVDLNHYDKSKYIPQNLFIKVVNSNNPNIVLAITETYPSTLPLPVTFDISPSPEIHLYKESITIQLWGDSSDLLASNTLKMEDYKIIFPIEMETENENVSFTVTGSWE